MEKNNKSQNARNGFASSFSHYFVARVRRERAKRLQMRMNPENGQTSNDQPDLIPTTPSREFPDGWFTNVPDLPDMPPTPSSGACLSCYERDNYPNLQHCDSCWSKAAEFMISYMQNPTLKCSWCNHTLNTPARGCHSCILRAFIFKYNEIVGVSFMADCSKFEEPKDVIQQNAKRMHGIEMRILKNPGSGITVIPYPRDWFLSIPEDSSALPTVRKGQCAACYKFMCIKDGEIHCDLCIYWADGMKRLYIKNSSINLPTCCHELNKPMRFCGGCRFRAYIVSYNIKNPNERFPIPVDNDVPPDKTEEGNSQTGELVEDNDVELIENEVPIVDLIDDAVSPNHFENEVPIVDLIDDVVSPTGFPDYWFVEVPKNENEPPTPRKGCCYSCYEFKPQLILNHCLDCTSKIAEINRECCEKDGKVSLPICKHKLNRPFRECSACIIVTYAWRQNEHRLKSVKPDIKPTKNFVCRSVKQLPDDKENHVQNKLKDSNLIKKESCPQLSSFINIGSSPDSQRHPLSIVFPNYDNYIKNVPKSCTPFPDGWFYEVSSDRNTPPVPNPDHCFSCYKLLPIEEEPLNKFFCRTCRYVITELRRRFFQNSETIIPGCDHNLNQPMIDCIACAVKTFVFRYEMKLKHPFFLTAASDKAPFPDYWFMDVSPDPNIAPDPYPGYCHACYHCIMEGDATKPFCNACYVKLRKMKYDFQENRVYRRAECHHQLNAPLRGCRGCIVKAYVYHYKIINGHSFF